MSGELTHNISKRATSILGWNSGIEPEAGLEPATLRLHLDVAPSEEGNDDKSHTLYRLSYPGDFDGGASELENLLGRHDKTKGRKERWTEIEWEEGTTPKRVGQQAGGGRDDRPAGREQSYVCATGKARDLGPLPIESND